MSRFVYFDFRGEFPRSISFPGSPVRYRYIVEVSKKDCDGGGRDPAELRRVARSLLHMSLGEEQTKIVDSSPEQSEVEQGHSIELQRGKFTRPLMGRSTELSEGWMCGNKPRAMTCRA